MTWRTIDDMEMAGKVVLTRVDINVPVENGKVTDTTRIERIAPTIRDILNRNGKPVLLAHFGRPKGKRVEAMSLSLVRHSLEDVLQVPVEMATDCIGPDAAASIATLTTGSVLLLENTRFHAGEESNDAKFADELAKLGDIYCNDAFSAAHRAHASTEGLAHQTSILRGTSHASRAAGTGKGSDEPRTARGCRRRRRKSVHQTGIARKPRGPR